MNSSTFNSNGEAKAILLTLLIVSVADLGLRLAEAGLSKDVQHIRSFPALARNLSAGPAPRVVFLGNSLTRHGVDPQGWEAALARRALPKGAMTMLVPDDTTMPDWYYVSLNQLIRPGHQPDLLVVGFALNQLSDERLEARRLGAYFCNLGNARELFDRDLDGFAPKVDFLLGRLCRLYGVRDEIQARVGDRFISGYQAGVRHLNELRRQNPSERNRAVPGNGPSYELLDRALALWRAEGIAVVLVAMPVPSRYEIDPVIFKKVRAAGARLMDARDLPGLTPADYPDGYHLGQRGAEIYTKFLAENLAGSLGQRADRIRMTARVR